MNFLAKTCDLEEHVPLNRFLPGPLDIRRVWGLRQSVGSTLLLLEVLQLKSLRRIVLYIAQVLGGILQLCNITNNK